MSYTQENPECCAGASAPGSKMRMRPAVSERLWSMADCMVMLPRKAVERALDTGISMVNPEVATHIVNSGKELLLAARSFVDLEIAMADRTIDRIRKNRSDKATAPAREPDEPPSV